MILCICCSCHATYFTFFFKKSHKACEVGVWFLMCKECEVQKTHQEQLKGFDEKEWIPYKHTHTRVRVKTHKEQIFFKLCAVVMGDGYQFKECLLSMI